MAVCLLASLSIIPKIYYELQISTKIIYIFPIKQSSKQASKPSFGLLASLNQACLIVSLVVAFYVLSPFYQHSLYYIISGV